MTDISPLIESLDKLLNVIDELADLGIVLKHIDLGGGLGVTYDQEKPPHPSEYLSIVRERLKDRALNLILEPGRSIAANAGICHPNNFDKNEPRSVLRGCRWGNE